VNPHLVFVDIEQTYSVSLAADGIKVEGPEETMSRLIALIVRQSEESYSPAYGDRLAYIAQQVSSRTGMKTKRVSRQPHEQNVVY
jgi:hypothetical protein